jgi:hypothetical protein
MEDYQNFSVNNMQPMNLQQSQPQQQNLLLGKFHNMKN